MIYPEVLKNKCPVEQRVLVGRGTAYYILILLFIFIALWGIEECAALRTSPLVAASAGKSALSKIVPCLCGSHRIHGF